MSDDGTEKHFPMKFVMPLTVSAALSENKERNKKNALPNPVRLLSKR